MGSYDCSSIHPRSPLVSLGGRYLFAEEMGSSLGFLGNPFGSMPGARDSGGHWSVLALAVVHVQPSARITASASDDNDFGAESSRPAPLLCTPRTHQSPGKWQHSLPDFSCFALAGRDLHPLDSDRRFHLLMFGSPSSKLFPTRYPVVSASHNLWCRRVPRPPFPKNLPEFQRQFATGETCEQYLAACRWPDGFVCSRCRHRRAYTVAHRRSQCAGCRHQVSLTRARSSTTRKHR
jgi:hypothetical protein